MACRAGSTTARGMKKKIGREKAQKAQKRSKSLTADVLLSTLSFAL
jgi:hypothetical protein